MVVKGYRQLIIARKDLHMSAGKLAAQVAHASMAFLTHQIRGNAMPITNAMNAPFDTPISQIEKPYEIHSYDAEIVLDKDTYENWIDGSFTKTVCEARNKNHLLRAIDIADGLGLKIPNYDYFLIRDNCLTDLAPEDEDGRTLTCIGFRPLPDEIAWQISKKYHLYTD